MNLSNYRSIIFLDQPVDVIRPVTRPSTVRCTLPMYIAFLLSEPNSVICLRVSDVLDMSHDSVQSLFVSRDLFTRGFICRGQKIIGLDRWNIVS